MKNSKKSNEIKIVDIETGEVIKLGKASKMQVSLYITDIATRRKDLQKLEKEIKDSFRDTHEFDEDNRAEFGNHRIVRSYSNRLSENLVKDYGTKKEKEWLGKLKDRHGRITESITWR